MAFGSWMKKITDGVKSFGNKIKETFKPSKHEEIKETYKPSREDMRTWIEHERNLGRRNFLNGQIPRLLTDEDKKI